MSRLYLGVHWRVFDQPRRFRSWAATSPIMFLPTTFNLLAPAQNVPEPAALVLQHLTCVTMGSTIRQQPTVAKVLRHLPRLVGGFRI